MSAKKRRGGGRQALLDAAHAEFAEGGFDRVGVAPILARAGVQPPTLYHHYGDKEGLYIAWAVSRLESLEPALAQSAMPGLSLASALELLASSLLARLDFDPILLLRDASLLVRSGSREQIMGAYLQAIYNPLYSVLVRGIGRGELRADPASQLAETFLGGIYALARQGRRSPEVAGWWASTFLRGAAKPS